MTTCCIPFLTKLGAMLQKRKKKCVCAEAKADCFVCCYKCEFNCVPAKRENLVLYQKQMGTYQHIITRISEITQTSLVYDATQCIVHNTSVSHKVPINCLMGNTQIMWPCDISV